MSGLRDRLAGGVAVQPGASDGTAFIGPLVGVELEYFVVDATTFAPVDVLDRLGAELFDGTALHGEFCAEQIEVASPPFVRLADLESWLVTAHVDLVARLHAIGARLLPVSLLDTAPLHVRDTPRNRQLVELFGEAFSDNATKVASDQVNIGSSDERDAFIILEAVRRLLPELLALSVASPLRLGLDSAVACNRLDAVEAALSRFPSQTGLPRRITSMSEYTSDITALAVLHEAGANYRYVRAMPQRGVAAEIRCLDKQPTLTRSLAFVALARALSLDSLASPDRGADDDQLLASRFDDARRGRSGSSPEALVRRVSSWLTPAEQRYLGPLFGPTPAQWLSDTARRVGLDRAYRLMADAFEHDLAALARRGAPRPVSATANAG